MVDHGTSSTTGVRVLSGLCLVDNEIIILIRSNKMQQYAGIYLLQYGECHVGRRLLLRYYDLYQRLHLQFYVLLMMGAMDTRNT